MKKILCILLMIGLLVGCSSQSEKEKNEEQKVAKFSEKEEEKISSYLYSLDAAVGGIEEVNRSKDVKVQNEDNSNTYMLELNVKAENSEGALIIYLDKKYKPTTIIYKTKNEYNSNDLANFLRIESVAFNNKLVDETETIAKMEFNEDSKINVVYDDITISIKKSEMKTLYNALSVDNK